MQHDKTLFSKLFANVYHEFFLESSIFWYTVLQCLLIRNIYKLNILASCHA